MVDFVWPKAGVLFCTSWFINAVNEAMGLTGRLYLFRSWVIASWSVNRQAVWLRYVAPAERRRARVSDRRKSQHTSITGFTTNIASPAGQLTAYHDRLRPQGRVIVSAVELLSNFCTNADRLYITFTLGLYFGYHVGSSSLPSIPRSTWVADNTAPSWAFFSIAVQVAFDCPIFFSSGAGSSMAGMAAPYQSAEICAVDFRGNHQNCCHQISDLKAKMHQNRFQLGHRPRPCWGAYSVSQAP